MTFSLYIAKDSPVHRTDARAKVVLLLAFSIGLFFIDSWWLMLTAVVLFVCLLGASRLPARSVFLASAPIYLICAITLIFNAFAFSEGSVHFNLDGLFAGCFMAVRICLLVWASLIVCYTTTSTKLVDAFVWYMQPLRRLHVPVDDVAMALSIALRFIPLVAFEYERMKEAQWSRGAPFDEGSIARRIRAHASVLLPLVVSLIRRADRLGMAMDARGYGMEKPSPRCYDDTH